MIFDTPIVSEGSKIINLTTDSGTVFPSYSNFGEIFFRTDTDDFFFRTGTTWVQYARLIDFNTLNDRTVSISGAATAAPLSLRGSGDVGLNVTSLDASKLTNIIPYAVTGGSSSLDQNGWELLPSGLLLQWGSITIPLDESGETAKYSGTITYPRQFSTLYSIQVNEFLDAPENDSAIIVFNAGGISATQARVSGRIASNYRGATGAQTSIVANWFAIGRP